jgi:hypothetical protein
MNEGGQKRRTVPPQGYVLGAGEGEHLIHAKAAHLGADQRDRPQIWDRIPMITPFGMLSGGAALFSIIILSRLLSPDRHRQGH